MGIRFPWILVREFRLPFDLAGNSCGWSSWQRFWIVGLEFYDGVERFSIPGRLHFYFGINGREWHIAM